LKHGFPFFILCSLRLEHSRNTVRMMWLCVCNSKAKLWPLRCIHTALVQCGREGDISKRFLHHTRWVQSWERVKTKFTVSAVSVLNPGYSFRVSLAHVLKRKFSTGLAQQTSFRYQGSLLSVGRICFFSRMANSAQPPLITKKLTLEIRRRDSQG
jgi:hypothetical protein